MYSHMDAMDIFNEVVAQLGTFGKYNLKKLILLWYPLTMYGMLFFMFIFTAGVTEYRCKVWECENKNYTDWISYAIPEANNGKLDKCSRFSTNGHKSQDVEVCSREWFDNKTIVPCNEYVYGDENTISKEFDLGCQEWKRTLVGTVRGVGLLISQVLSGVLSDRYGRKFVLIFASTSSAILGLIRSFSPNYIAYLILDFLDASVSGGIIICVLTLMMEMITPKGRIITQNILYATMYVGAPCLGLVSWAFQDWRLTNRILQTPLILVFLYTWLIDESVRWLIVNGKKDEAIRILRKAVRLNFSKDDVPETLANLYRGADNPTNAEELQHLGPDVPPAEHKLAVEPHSDLSKEASIKQVFQSPKLRWRMLMMVLIWLGTSLLYNGLNIYGLQYLPGNKYLNFLFLNMADPVLVFLSTFVTLRFGRKKVMSITYIICSFCCFVVIAVPSSWVTILIIIYPVSKYATKLCYNSLYGITGEIFPTNLRNTFMGFGVTAGKIGFITASQMPLLATYMESLPVILFGLIALCMCFTLIPLPETVNVKLPDTIEEAERMKT